MSFAQMSLRAIVTQPDKHSSLLFLTVSDEEKKFYKIDLGKILRRLSPLSAKKVRPVANVIKHFCPYFTDFHNKLECLSLVRFPSLV
jgi:hypothetical protein